MIDKPAPDDHLAVVFAMALGVVVWMAGLTDFPAEERNGPVFLAAVLPLVVLAAPTGLGFAFPGAAVRIGPALAVGPLILAGFTASRGDGDGLWLLALSFLAIGGFVLDGPAFAGAWLRARSKERGKGFALGKRRIFIVALYVAGLFLAGPIVVIGAPLALVTAIAGWWPRWRPSHRAGGSSVAGDAAEAGAFRDRRHCDHRRACRLHGRALAQSLAGARGRPR